MLIDRFIKYTTFDTQSDESSDTIPSTSKQKVLGEYLLNEIKSLGLENCQMDEYGYVYGYLDGDHNMPTIGLNAHIDTVDAASGKDVKARIIENYDGNDIKLNDNVITEVKRFPFLKDFIGKTLVVTDGNTLLGADDKAGIAIIVETLERLVNNPNIKHGPIWVCFSPDEEIGRGTIKFNFDLFKVDFAYTLDGDNPNNIEFENFNAASAEVKLNGISVHPGTAKNKMVNAIKLAMEFDSYLDQNAVPEKTEGYEGFNHLSNITGECASASMSYIIRNHDINKLNQQKQDFIDITNKMNEKYGYECVTLTLKDAYRNMREKFEGNMYPIELVKEAMDELNMNFKACAIRGGTDGADLTWKGILCPNLGTGGRNYHGVHEFWCKQEGELAVDLLIKILSIAKK